MCPLSKNSTESAQGSYLGQFLNFLKMTLPILTVFHVSSSNASQSWMTMLGRNDLMSTGLLPKSLNAVNDTSDVNNMGATFEKITCNIISHIRKKFSVNSSLTSKCLLVQCYLTTGWSYHNCSQYFPIVQCFGQQLRQTSDY